MNVRTPFIAVICFILLVSILPLESSAIELEGESSNVTVRLYVDIHDDGLIIMNFKVLWGSSEFTSSDIYRPQAHPPVIPWADLEWDTLKDMISPIDTIEYLFNYTFSGGRTITYSKEYFVEKVLDIDTSFTIESTKPRILDEFQTFEIKMEIMPSQNSYTISPLAFLSDIDFKGFPPVAELELEAGPSIDIQATSFSLNHFMYPEGHRFKSEALYFDNDRITYDTSEDSIKVRKLPPVLSATILFSLWIGTAILSMIVVAVAARKAKEKANKGFEMWVGIGAVCFMAFLPFHLILSFILIIAGFGYSVRKSKMLLPVSEKTGDDAKGREDEKSDIPGIGKETGKEQYIDPDKKPISIQEKAIGENRSIGGMNIEDLLPPPMPFSDQPPKESASSLDPPPLSDHTGTLTPPTPSDQAINPKNSFDRPIGEHSMGSASSLQSDDDKDVLYD